MTIMDSSVMVYGVWTDYQYIILSNFGLPPGSRIWWDMKWKKGNINFDSILVMIMEWQWVQTPYSRTIESMMVILKKIRSLDPRAQILWPLEKFGSKKSIFSMYYIYFWTFDQLQGRLEKTTEFIFKLQMDATQLNLPI